MGCLGEGKEERKGSSESRPEDSRDKKISCEPLSCQKLKLLPSKWSPWPTHPSSICLLIPSSIYSSISPICYLSTDLFLHPFKNRVLRISYVPSTVPGTRGANIKRHDHYSHISHNVVGKRERQRNIWQCNIVWASKTTVQRTCAASWLQKELNFDFYIIICEMGMIMPTS